MTLGEVCDFQGGSQPPKEEWISEPREGYVRMLQIRDFTQSRSFEIEYVKESKRLKYCCSDDVLLGRYGASVGKVLTGLSGAYNVAIMKTIPNEKFLNKSLFRYFLQSPRFQVFLQTVSTMRAAQAGFSKEDIQDFIISIPSLPEQESIVAELDCLSGVIEKQKQQLKELDSLAQAIFYDMFGDPITNEKGWDIKKLEKLCDILDAQRKPVTKKDRREGCYPYYGATGIQDYVDSYIFDGRYLLVGEDGAKWGALDKTAFIIEGKCWVNNHAHILKINNLAKDTYLEYYLTVRDLNEYITGAIVPKLTQQALRNIAIPTPPMDLQTEFAAKIVEIEKQKELIKQSLSETEKLFSSRMDYYFN